MSANRNLASRRDFLRLSALGAAGVVAAACAAPAAAPAAEESAEEEMPASAEPVEIRLSHWWGDQHKKWLPIVEEKSGRVYKAEIYPYGEYVTKVLTQVAGGVAPDIIQLGGPMYPDFFPRGIFVPFNDVLAESGIDMSKWYADPVVEHGYKGDIMGLSLFTQQAMMVYLNLDLVRNAGYAEADLPLWGGSNFDQWSWDDFVDFMKAVTIRSSDGSVEQYGYQSAETSINAYGYQLATYDTWFIDDTEYEETQCLLDTPEAISAVHDYVDLTVVHGVAPTLEAQQGIEGGLFRAGLAAASVSWSNQTYLAAQLPFELGFMHLPWVERRVHGVNANLWCINKESAVIPKAQEASIVQTTDYEVGQALVDLAATLSAYDPAYYLDSLPEGDLGIIVQVMLSRLAGMSECDYCTEDVNIFKRAAFGRVGRFMQDKFRSGVELAFVGEKTVEEAMLEAKAAIDKEIEASASA